MAKAIRLDVPPPVHEAAEGFPKASDEAIAALAEDIRKIGLRVPLQLLDGKLIDGRSRLAACEQAGVAPRYEAVTGDPFALAWSFNGKRRDLSEVVKVLCGLWCEAGSQELARVRGEVAEGKAEANREAALEQHSGSASNVSEPTGRDHAVERARKTASLIAANFATSTASVEKALRIRPTPFEPPVRLCLMKPTEALRQIRKDELAGKVAELPDSVYRVIYADPPWSYNDARQTGDHRETTGTLKHYATMTMGEITGLEVEAIAADDAVLFLWATFPLLAEGLAVIKAWGFTYKTAFVWDKDRSNFGHYHDACAELLMVATRGSCVPEIDKRYSQIQVHARGRHSAKPDAFRAMIDDLYPSGPRLELFRRGDPPEGWDTWGAEAEDET